jgi:hypothetical protein
MVKLAVLLDPLRILYSLAPLVLVAIPVPSGGPEDIEVIEQSLKSFEILLIGALVFLSGLLDCLTGCIPYAEAPRSPAWGSPLGPNPSP